MTADQVTNVARVGGRLIVMPHADRRIVQGCKSLRSVRTTGLRHSD
jgi:2-keto-3-deoxy-6-phosphogluconate aldolase